MQGISKENLRIRGRSGAKILHVMNPKGGEVEINGDMQHVYTNLGEVFSSDVDSIEILIITISSNYVLDILRQIPKGKVRAVIISSGGFGEKDEEGKRAEEIAKEIADDRGFEILGINTLGVFTHAWNSSFTDPPTGNEISLPGKSVVFVQSGE